MAKVRVHELAKELGVTSKKLLEVLKESGEFVKSASSTIEAPVVRKAREYFDKHPDEGGAKKAAPAKEVKESKAKETPTATQVASNTPPEKEAVAVPKPRPAKDAADALPPTKQTAVAEQSAVNDVPVAKPQAPAPRAPKPASPKTTPGDAHRSAEAAREAAPPRPQARRGGPRPGNSPFASRQGMGRGDGKGRGPRPGNSPYGSSQGMGSRGGRPSQGGDQSAQRGGRDGGRGGAPRGGRPGVSPATMSGQFGTQFQDGASRGGRGGRGGQGAGQGKFGGAPAGLGAGNGRGGFTRGGGKARGGSTAGAFGRQGGRGNKKSKRTKRQEFEEMQSPMLAGVQVPRGDGHTEVRVRAGASLADFAERIQADPAALVTVLFRMGEMATANQSLDEDTFQLLGAELGYDIKIMSAEDEDREILEAFSIDLDAEKEDEDPDSLKRRAPVVTVMGHVDHGKTKLLDAIRHTDVVEDEAGGITQSIGAYQTTVHVEDRDRHITFIDTPGHEAFTAMRARGADVTDVAVLVVAANDGVMPQTVEAINHAKAANVPIVVAVNKIDVDGANADKVRAQLTEYGLVAEEYGGDVPFVDISAKKRLNIPALLDAILATSDILVEPKANPDKAARGVAIEAKLDQGRGSVVTALVQDGTLHVGDPIVVGTAYGTVRAMIDDRGHRLKEAGPSRPVQVLGLKSVPDAGDQLIVADDERTARQISEKRESAKRAATLAKRRKRISLEDLNAAIEEGKVENLNLIIKGDSSGAVEALESSLYDIEVPSDEVQVNVIHRGVGNITQSDVDLATVDNAVIIGFNVRPAERVADMADREGIELKFYSVIYDAINDVEDALKGKLKPIYEEAQLGTAEVRALFKSGKAGIIAGSIVRSGSIKRGTKARLLRGESIVESDLEIVSLRREKDDVTEVKEGYECGITLGVKDVQVGDIIETWEMREKPRN